MCVWEFSVGDNREKVLHIGFRILRTDGSLPLLLERVRGNGGGGGGGDLSGEKKERERMEPFN